MYLGEEYTLVRNNPNTIEILNNNPTKDSLFKGKDRNDVIDIFLNSSQNKEFIIKDVEKDITILYVL